MNHAYQVETFRRLKIQTQLISNLEGEKDQLSSQVQQLQKELEGLNLARVKVQQFRDFAVEWGRKYTNEVQRSRAIAQQVVAEWRASDDFTQEVGKAIAIHGEAIYLNRW